MTDTNEVNESLDSTFPLEKILTASAGDYVKSQSKSLSDYEMVGVHQAGGWLSSPDLDYDFARGCLQMQR